METTWTPLATIPATLSDPQLTPAGVTFPAVELATADGALVVALLGPVDEVTEVRLTAAEARTVAAALLVAAESLEASL